MPEMDDKLLWCPPSMGDSTTTAGIVLKRVTRGITREQLEIDVG